MGWGAEDSEFTAQPPGLTVFKIFLVHSLRLLVGVLSVLGVGSATQSDIAVCDVTVQHCTV